MNFFPSCPSLSATVSRVKEIISLICCLSYYFNDMGAEDAFANPQFLTSSSPTSSAALNGIISSSGGGGVPPTSVLGTSNGGVGADGVLGGGGSFPSTNNNGSTLVDDSGVGGSKSPSSNQLDHHRHAQSPIKHFRSSLIEKLERGAESNIESIEKSHHHQHRHAADDDHYHEDELGSIRNVRGNRDNNNNIRSGAKSVDLSGILRSDAKVVSACRSNKSLCECIVPSDRSGGVGKASSSSNSCKYVSNGNNSGTLSCVAFPCEGMDCMLSSNQSNNNAPTTVLTSVHNSTIETNTCTTETTSTMGTSIIEGEWHQKYAFIVGLLRKPHVLLVKDSLTREREKLCNKLSAYRLERNIVRESINKYIQNGSETSAQQSLTAQIKHLDMMCVTLERQIDVLGNVDHALPATENIYSGEPDSLDGTSSEIMPHDDDLDRRHMSNHSTGINSTSHHTSSHHMSNVGNNRSGFGGGSGIGGNTGGFQLQINGRSPLDALAMLHLERCAHRETRKELNQLRKKYELLRDEFDSGEGLSQSTSLLFSRLNGDLEEDEMFSNDLANDDPAAEMSIGTDESNSRLVEEVRMKDVTISQLRNRLLHLEKARMDKVPVDAAREIARLHAALVQLERVRDELTLQNFTLKSKLAELSARISDSATYRLEKPNNNNNNNANSNNGGGINGNKPLLKNSGATTVVLSPSPETPSSLSPTSAAPGSAFSDEGVGGVHSTSATSNSTDDLRLRRKSTYKISHNIETNGEIKQLRSLINDLHAKELEYQRKLSTLETELKNMKNQYADECATRTESDRVIRQLEEQLDITQRRLEETERTFLTKEEECSAIKLDVDTLNEENRRLKDDLNMLHLKVEKEQSRSIEKISKFEKELGSILEVNRNLQEDCQRERLLRKKYHNMVEELKGKIRVFCRIRPPSKSEKISNEIVAKCSDPYTISLETTKGHKEFQFDRVFTQEDTQEEIFADTQNLIQSAFDGYNVCICAYGQTGSGKTYTILGDDAHPGIAPRTFAEIFLVADEMSQTYETTVSFYVLELYNDRLIDLLSPNCGPNSGDADKLEIRRDRRGTVWVSGARVLPAEDSSSLEKSFRQALTARHTAATRMNDRSSRSHLIVGLIIETTSKINGTVLRGKISLVDLAGSERTGKSGVSADTLREANAINKSLSAFGDVINALTTDQAFVPYRNNKLTLLMQDSIGGNAKTLMFVNISPSSYNLEETIISLSYGQRLKQVTNGATRNAESREVARLKSVIHRMKRGEVPPEAEEMFM